MRYPADWESRGAELRIAAGNRCQTDNCRLVDGAVGLRDDDGLFIEAAEPDAVIPDGRSLIRIVLTVAHLYDSSPENCSPRNLALFCQRCHNTWDARMRGQHASATRRERKAIGDLFATVLYREKRKTHRQRFQEEGTELWVGLGETRE